MCRRGSPESYVEIRQTQNFFRFRQKKDISNAEEVAAKSPKGLFTAKGGKLIPGDEMQSHLWDGCLDLIQPNDAIEVIKNENEVCQWWVEATSGSNKGPFDETRCTHCR